MPTICDHLSISFSHQLHFVSLLPVSTVWNVIYNKYDPFFTKNLYFRTKNHLWDLHLIAVLLEILGGREHGPSHPHLNFLGTASQSLPKYRYAPIVINVTWTLHWKIRRLLLSFSVWWRSLVRSRRVSLIGLVVHFHSNTATLILGSLTNI